MALFALARRLSNNIILTASGVIVLLGPRHRTALVSHHDDAKADAAGGPREHPNVVAWH